MPVAPRSGVLQAELVDERRGRSPRPSPARPRVRHVGEEGAERDDELDAEVAGEARRRARVNVRQRRFGSTPSSRTASRSAPGIGA